MEPPFRSLRRTAWVVGVLVALVSRAGPQDAHALAIERVGAVTSLAGFQFPPLTPPPFAEITPWFTHRDGSFRYFVTTDRTYECLARDALLTGAIRCRRDRTRLVTEDEADRFTNPALIPSGTAYKRTYEGVFTAQLIGGTVVAIDHGENGNEIRQQQIDGQLRNVRYHNSVEPRDTSCWGGFAAGAYRSCDRDYFAFVDSSSAPATPGTAAWRDHGPVVWPRNGYLRPGGGKASWGLRHPYSIVAGGYLYVFYLDTGDARRDPSGLPTQGLGAGIAVARSPSWRLGRPGTFKTWDGSRDWHPALPQGFSVAREQRYFDRAGGQSAAVLGPGRGSYYFAVARIGRPSRWRYLGLEYRSVAHTRSCDGETSLGYTLWQSNDLIRWHHPTTIARLTSCGADQHAAYDGSPIRFAHFLDSSGTREQTVNPKGFDLIGTSAAGVTLVRVSVTP